MEEMKTIESEKRKHISMFVLNVHKFYNIVQNFFNHYSNAFLILIHEFSKVSILIF
jgi:hypothetical protein